MSFSVIIPNFNEKKIILQQIRDVKRLIDTEIIIVEGGSTDSTKKICEKEHVTILSSPKGRGTQCRVGAQAASNEYLIFLHADTRLPGDTSRKLSSFFSNNTTVHCSYGLWSISHKVKTI